MAIKPFNSIGGISVGSNLELSISANNDATLRDLSANGTVLLNSSGNVQLGNVANVHIDGGANGQYLATDGSGGLSWVTLDTDTLANGTSNVSIDTVNGPITMGVDGIANVVIVDDTLVTIQPNLYVSNSANITGSLALGVDANIGGNVSILGTLGVTGAANLSSTLGVAGATEISNTLVVTQGANLQNTLVVGGAANLNSTLGVSGAASLDSTLSVLGAANLASTLYVSGNANLASTLQVSGAANLDSTLGVLGSANFAGTVGIAGATEISNTLVVTQGANLQSTLVVGGAANINSTLGVSGAVEISNTLGVTGAANLASTLTVTGDITGNANIAISGDATVSGNLAVTGDASWTNGNAAMLDLTTGLSTANLSANGNVTLGDVANVHIAGGTNGQVLKTDGAGNLTWETNAILVNGTSNVSIPDVNGNVTVSSNGQANIISVYSNGTHATTSITNDAIITGNLTVQGNVTNIDTTTLNVQDPIITEGRGANNSPLTTNDGLDRGLYSWYYDTAAASEKGGFIGYKNAGAFAGHYVIAQDATLSNDVVSISTYADVVIQSLVSGPAGNVAGISVSSIDMGSGANISFKANSHVDLVVIASDNVDIDTNLQVTGNISADGNIQTDGHITFGNTLSQLVAATTFTSNSTQTMAVLPDAAGRAIEFFVTSRDISNVDFETAKYLAISDGNGVVDFTTYGTIRIGNSTGTVSISESVGNILFQVTSTGQTYWTVQYQVVNV